MASYPGEGCVERDEDVWNAGVCLFQAEKWDSVWNGGFVGCGCETCCLDFRLRDRFPWSVSGVGRLSVLSGKVGGGGNMVLWNSVALSSNVVKLSPSWVRTGVRWDRLGLVYLRAWKISLPSASDRYFFHSSDFALRISLK